jgi:hypothetical protein
MYSRRFPSTTLTQRTDDFVDKNDDKENEIEMISDDAFYFARLSAPLPRNADNARHDELHADILALRTKRIRDQNMQTKMNEANLRSLYETRFKKNAQNRKEFRRVRALRMT